MGRLKRSRIASTSNIRNWHQSKKLRIDGTQHQNNENESQEHRDTEFHSMQSRFMDDGLGAMGNIDINVGESCRRGPEAEHELGMKISNQVDTIPDILGSGSTTLQCTQSKGHTGDVNAHVAAAVETSNISTHFHKVQCEEVIEDDDIIAMHGIRWREKDQQFHGIIEEIVDPPHSRSDGSEVDMSFGDLDAETEEESSDDADEDISGDTEGNGSKRNHRFELRKPPSVAEAREALGALRALLKPPRGDQKGFKDAKLPAELKERLVHMSNFLWLYTDVSSNGSAHSANPVGGQWIKAADKAARNAGKSKGNHLSRCLRHWSKAYIKKRVLPNRAPSKKFSRIDDESLASDLQLHLRSIGKYVRAEDLVDYLSIAENQSRLGFKNTISFKTAQRWMKHLGYQWKTESRGQYSDGHERDDVVKYRQTVFIPTWCHYQPQMRAWNYDNPTMEEKTPASSSGRHVVLWFHDESTFYANDRRKQRWVHEKEGAALYPKGEGASIMVSDFISADYGWLRSPDGKDSSRVLFKAGKSRDGYFKNEDILAQTEKAMDILQKCYPDEDHIFVFDNATTHLKRAEDALSARRMPKGPSESWGIWINKKDDSGRPVHGADGKPLKEKIRMGDGHLPNGDLQPLYFPDGHEKAGWFKGMAQILTERGYENCWGYAKRLYRTKPWSSSEAALEKNVIDSLEGVPLTSMRRSARFIDAYRKGLDGQQAAWAVKKYKGHRVIPENILKEFDDSL
ncbi:hypothetical protein BJ138DRAFT_1106667 [Hygrophoropsis aurantiaca]|uniref:Uncharacterized protein n=1 Tax=Hygrophoropsis aurantiaca TaxID=72124 RepID=A0ACB7ZUJ7_9AGAM|nr:hypothetical protein BJ138DRAFT_1106667 [Hygrophoropsis aurantiaca]